MILDRAGAGGMGVVYRARDERTGETVALKVLHKDQRPDRFLREAAVLSGLSHPAVVRYVAHGVTSDGQVFLAMEWLEGESLSSILGSRRLALPDCLTLLRRVCSGLAVAHQMGVVHRDLKPANILIPDGSLAAAKLIDFGIARRRFDPRLTERGLLIGTLAYMSPEQARGASQIEPTSDVFSLGSVVYKCITGEAPFGSGDSTAILAKVLLEDPTPVGERVPGVPPGFDAMVSRMLAKAPEGRPRDAAAVLALADALATDEQSSGAAGITIREQRVVWVVLTGGNVPDDGETQERPPELASTEDPSGHWLRLVGAAGGRYDLLANGTQVASFVGGGAPQDEALRAARVAEVLRDELGGPPVAMASGLGVMGGRAPMGEAIERGAALLARARPGEIALDDVTARLLRDRYEILDGRSGEHCLGARREIDAVRTLLGRPTRSVGRERELATLEALVDECVDAPVARVALVIGASGVGKSRVRYELLRWVREHHPEAEVLFGRAESTSRGSPFALLGGALRRAADVRDGETLGQSQQKIRELVRRLAGETFDGETTAAFLGELAEVTFPDDACPTLLAARQNPTLLGDSMRSAWLDFLGTSCRQRPILCVLEDLQWGDLPSITFLDTALSELGDAPLFVLGLARPDVFDVLPSLFARREPHEVRLGPLKKSAALALAREVLGDDFDAARLERAVELADGNAFFLEELLRALSEGESELPETVLGILQSRLAQLGVEARRVLRAASVFGSQFWFGGVKAVLGRDVDVLFLSTELEELERKELISRRRESSLAGEDEWAFRHATLHEAVYATLTPDDARLGHALAGSFLEQTGARDALSLAEHFRKGDVPEKATRYLLVAAEQALEGADLVQVLLHVERALGMNPDDATRGELHYLASDAQFWSGNYQEAERHARAAVELLAPGSARWFMSIGALTSATGTLGKDQELIAWAARAEAEAPTSEEARATRIVALVRASHGHLKLGLNEAADSLIRHAEQAAGELTKLTALGSAWVHHAKSARAYYDGDVARFIQEVELSIPAFDAAGDSRTGSNARANLGYAVLMAGDLPRAERLLREAMVQCERVGTHGIGHYVMHNLGLALALRGAVDEGLELERRALHEADTRKETLLLSATHLYLALILSMAGRHEEAVAEARAVRESGASIPILRAQSHAAESAALLALGRRSEALERARDAMALLDEHGGTDETEGRVRAAWVEALLDQGEREAAAKAVALAVSRLGARASRLDPALARCFRENLPEHARLYALASELGVPLPAPDGEG